MTPAQYTQRNEGCKLKAYPDSRGIPTVGFGCKGYGITLQTVWTPQQASDEFDKRYLGATTDAALDIGAAYWGSLDVVRRAVLADMAYQLGAHGLAEFEVMLADVQSAIRDHMPAQDWAKAGAALMDSLYAKQVPFRAARNKAMLITGQWPQEPW